MNSGTEEDDAEFRSQHDPRPAPYERLMTLCSVGHVPAIQQHIQGSSTAVKMAGVRPR